MKTELTRLAIDASVHHGYTPDTIWWGTEGEPGHGAHMFILLANNGFISPTMGHAAVVDATGLKPEHVHVTSRDGIKHDD